LPQDIETPKENPPPNRRGIFLNLRLPRVVITIYNIRYVTVKTGV
jgi:hypothetical protein